MRAIAVLASFAVAVAAASLPASLVTVASDTHAGWTAASSPDERHDCVPGADTPSEPEEDDDLDERFDDVDALVAVIDELARTVVRDVRLASWPAHETHSPRAPHLEDTLRPPIA